MLAKKGCIAVLQREAVGAALKCRVVLYSRLHDRRRSSCDVGKKGGIAVLQWEVVGAAPSAELSVLAAP